MDEKEWIDPIVAEIRAIRDAHAEKFMYDPNAMFDDILRKQEELKKHGYKFIRREPKKLLKLTGTHS